MSADYLKILTVLLMTVSCAGKISAQDNSIGMAYTFSCIGLCYERDIRQDTFIDLSLKAETGEILLDRATAPGISASFTWNTILGSRELNETDRIDFFAGPGVHVGWSQDFRKGKGINFGLKGSVGLRFRFARNAEISLCVSPVIGIHMTMQKEGMRMEYYRYGLLNTIIPEAGIRYRF